MNIDQTRVLRSSQYDHDAVSIGIVHVGLGAFHRAHQAYYIDEYMDKTGDLNWGIAAVNLRKEDSATFAKVATSKDGYTLKTISATGDTEYQLIRSHMSHTDWNHDYNSAVELVANPTVKVVTMTVTESGYYLDSSGQLDPNATQIVAEKNGEQLQSIYAYLRVGLQKRILSNAGPITLMSCDNLRHNGKLLKDNFLKYLQVMGDIELIKWLEENASFPSSMVDRITPKPTLQLEQETTTLFGRTTDSPVLGEDFIQWVIEEDFKNDFPNLSKVDVTITNDIEPYEETKIRVLNGGHTCLVYLGALMELDTYDELMHTDELYQHYRSFEEQEVLPALPRPLPFDAEQYLETVTTRFTNTHIADSVERICMDGFSKFPIFVLPTVRGCLEIGITPTYAIRSIASWYVFADKIYNSSFAFKYVEPYSEELKALLGPENLDLFTTSQALWDDVPEKYELFSSLLRQEIKSLEKRWPL